MTDRMTPSGLPSVVYDPVDGPSLFDRWEHADDSGELPRTLAVHDERYRAILTSALEGSNPPGRRLVSVGAGNGFVESDLARAGWDVLATDSSTSACAHCAEKGLTVVQFDLLADSPPGAFDVVYADGLLGHLWNEQSGCGASWAAFEALAKPGSVLCVSNDLADTDDTFQTVVSGSEVARYFRPPAGWFARDAASCSNWTVRSTSTYEYQRRGYPRRREITLFGLTDGQSGSTSGLS